MEKLTHLFDQLEEELEDAKKYAKCAMRHKETDRSIAEAYIRMSAEELGHAEIIKGMIEKEVMAEKEDGAAHWIWKWEHERYAERAAQVKAMHSAYKG